MARRSVNKKTVRVTIAFTTLTIFLMVAPALASAYFGFNIYTVMSGSMRPYMHPGDEILTDVVSAHDVHVGEVILAVNPDNFEQVAHRIVNISTTDNVHYTITTKGDENPIADTPALTFHTNAPIRKVVGVIPKVGYVLDAISSTATKTAGSIFLIGYLVYLIRKTRETVKPALATDEEIAKKVEALVQNHLQSLAASGFPQSKNVAAPQTPEITSSVHYGVSPVITTSHKDVYL